MGYFRELPDIAYQSPLLHKNSSKDYVIIKNIFRRSKLLDYLKDNVSVFNKFVIGDGDRPDTIAESLYGDSSLDYVVILVAGITNINNEWPLQDYQVYEYALAKYGSETAMNEIRHHETYEIKDNMGRQILPPNLIVDGDFKIDGTSSKYNTTYTLISQAVIFPSLDRGNSPSFYFQGFHILYTVVKWVSIIWLFGKKNIAT